MTAIYCGNNRLEPRLLSGELNLGTNYKCLQKGIVKGKSLPKYENNYQKIDERKIYCGKSNQLPYGYDYMGNLPICLSKGIGIGKARFAFGDKKANTLVYLLIFVINFILLSVLLYLIKPNFVLKYNKKTKTRYVNWYKLSIISITSSIITVFVVYVLNTIK